MRATQAFRDGVSDRRNAIDRRGARVGGPAGQAAGFTLIEILIVVVLISVVVSMAVVRVDRNVDKIAYLEAKKFRRLVELLREESVITGKIMGVKVDPSNRTYEFLRHQGSWEALSKDNALREQTFAEGIDVAFDVRRRKTNRGGKKNDKKKSKNIPSGVVMVEPVGNVTPFTLTLGGEDVNWKVALDEDLNVTIDSERR